MPSSPLRYTEPPGHDEPDHHSLRRGDDRFRAEPCRRTVSSPYRAAARRPRGRQDDPRQGDRGRLRSRSRRGRDQPTFTLVHEYRGPHITLYHIDLYRIDTERELETLGLDDLLAPNCILLIEWGEKFPRLQRDQNLEICLERMGETERKIEQTTVESLDRRA